jgi:AraC-like DNA-binding protein
MLLFISLFTIVISCVLLVFNWKINKNALFLSCFFIILSIYGMAHYFTVYYKDPFWLAVFYNHFTPLMLLLGPLLLFYVRGTLTDTDKLSRLDVLHFIPGLIHFIGIVPYLFMPFGNKLKMAAAIINDINIISDLDLNIFFSPSFSFSFRPVLLLLYIFYCIYLLWKFMPLVSHNKLIPGRQSKIAYRWLIVLITSLTIIVLNFMIVTYNSLSLKPSVGLQNIYFIHNVSALAYCIMSFSLLLFPNILYGIPKRVLVEPAEKEVKSNRKIRTRSQKKTQNDKDPFEDLSEKIAKYLEREKPFLNPDFSISDIYIYFKVPKNHISYCVNTIMGTRFSKMKSELRVRHAIGLLQSGLSNSLTIEAIGERSGFKTRSHFYAAFKEETGVSPTEFISNQEHVLN